MMVKPPNKLFVATLGLLISASCASVSAATAPAVTGAFVQFNGSAHSQNWWDTELGAMHDIGMDTLVLQYVGYGNSYYYPTSVPGVSGSGTDTVGRILQAADTLGMDVYVGLQLNTGSFDLNQNLARGAATLSELNTQYGSHASLAGWYVPQELSDQIIFNDPALRDDLVSYIGQISQQAHSTTGLPVMISPYFGQTPDASAYANWWDTTGLASTGVDVFALQDGVGTHRTSIAESQPVFQAFGPVMQSHGVSFWANNESFNQTHGWPVDEQPWAAEPTDINTFTAQVQSTAPYVDKAITFEFSSYMSPQASAAADALYQDYASYLDTANDNVIAVAGYTYDNPADTSFHASAPDTGNTLLIDGAEGSLADGPGSAFANGSWVGFVNDAPDGGPQPRVLLDLGGTYPVDSVEVFYLVSAAPFIFAPQPVPGIADAITVQTSTDGATFSSAASSNDFNSIAEDQAASAFEVRSVVLDLGGAEASHIAIDLRTPYSYTFLGEIKVYQAALPGDLNGDGYVGLDDLQPILDHWNQTVTLGDSLQGDVSGPGGSGPDGYVGLDDLQPVLDHWNSGTLPSSTAPEPSGIAVWAMAGHFIIFKRRWVKVSTDAQPARRVRGRSWIT